MFLLSAYWEVSGATPRSMEKGRNTQPNTANFWEDDQYPETSFMVYDLKFEMWNPGDQLPVWLDNTNLNDPLVWRNMRQFHVFM